MRRKPTSLQEFARAYNWMHGVVSGWARMLFGHSYTTRRVHKYLTPPQQLAWKNAYTAINELSEALRDYQGALKCFKEKGAQSAT